MNVLPTPAPEAQPIATALPHLEHAVNYDGSLADAVRDAARTLDLEEHRYVERFQPCPNGCEFEPAGDRRLAGPADCDLCDYGSVEDEDAPQMNPLIGALMLAAASLEAIPTWVAPLVRYALAADDEPLDFGGQPVPDRIQRILEAAFAVTCSACGRVIRDVDGVWLDENGGYCMPTGGAMVRHEPARPEASL